MKRRNKGKKIIKVIFLQPADPVSAHHRVSNDRGSRASTEIAYMIGGIMVRRMTIFDTPKQLSPFLIKTQLLKSIPAGPDLSYIGNGSRKW